MARHRFARYGPLVPNSLTVLRLGVAVTFPFVPTSWRLAMVLVGGLSDALDGFAARRLHVSTWIGALLDGIADKLFTLSVLVTLTLAGPLSWLQLGLLLTRDVVVALIAAYVGVVGPWSSFKRVAARVSGKVTTTAIFAMLVAILWRPTIGRPMVWVAVASSLFAAADYVVAFVRWKVWGVEPGHLTAPSETAPHPTQAPRS